MCCAVHCGTLLWFDALAASGTGTDSATGTAWQVCTTHTYVRAHSAPAHATVSHGVLPVPVHWQGVVVVGGQWRAIQELFNKTT